MHLRPPFAYLDNSLITKQIGRYNILVTGVVPTDKVYLGIRRETSHLLGKVVCIVNKSSKEKVLHHVL